MNNVIISAKEISLPSWSSSICGFALKVLNDIKRDNWELSILLCTDKIITELNAQYRNKNEPTDILSFSLGSEIQEDGITKYLPGDIVISLDTLKENAEFFKTDEDKELRRLIIHGILHLNGMDHKCIDIEKEPMLALQEEILDKFKNERIIPQKILNGEKE